MVRHCLGRVLALDSLTDPELDLESGVGKEALTPALEVAEAIGWSGIRWWRWQRPTTACRKHQQQPNAGALCALALAARTSQVVGYRVLGL